MAIHVKVRETEVIAHEYVHLVPCKIEYDGDANVSKYFQQLNPESGDQVLKASFRGHPLQGQVVEIPKNYIGVVTQETVSPITENVERNFHVTHKFKSVTFWNWDKNPSKNDAFLRALDWIDIAEALHAPVSSS